VQTFTVRFKTGDTQSLDAISYEIDGEALMFLDHTGSLVAFFDFTFVDDWEPKLPG